MVCLIRAVSRNYFALWIATNCELDILRRLSGNLGIYALVVVGYYQFSSLEDRLVKHFRLSVSWSAPSH